MVLQLRLGLFAACLLLLPLLDVFSQDAAKEYDLTWKLPHDRAAVYEVFDLQTGVRKTDFWLLGCDLTRRIGSTDFTDLPLRFIFRTPRMKLTPGSSWEIRETAFGDLPIIHPGIDPVEISGSYRVHPIKKVRLEEVFRAGHKTRKERTDPVEVALVEGHLDLYRCGWVNKQVAKMEKVPSANLSTITAFRLSDSAILGARYQFSGRAETYDGKWSGPKIGKLSEGRDFILTESLVSITKEGLKPSIDNAVDKGIKWLRSQQVDGSFADRGGYAVGTAQGIGSTAVCLLALLHSGVPVDDPAARRGFAYIANKRINQSYDLALVLMAIEGKYLPMTMLEDVEKYSEDKAREEISKRVSKEDKETAESAVRALLETQSESGAFGYAGGAGYPNLSSTQYAILGLKSASRLGIRVPTNVWERTLAYIEKARVIDGKEVSVAVERWSGGTESRYSRLYGWGYIFPRYPPATGAMTAAAISTMLICGSELLRVKAWSEREAKALEEQVWGGLAWLQEQHNLRAGTPEGCVYGSAMLLYYLYGLERAFILSDIKSLGGHDWYLEGAGILLSMQQNDGRWEAHLGTPLIDSAMALLFLKRATIPVRTDSRGTSPGGGPK